MLELPDARRQRFVTVHALPEYDAAQLTQSREPADFFEETVRAGAAPKAASNWMMGELARALKESDRTIADSPVSPERLAGLLALIEQGTISGAIAKDVFEKMLGSSRRRRRHRGARGPDADRRRAELFCRTSPRSCSAPCRRRRAVPVGQSVCVRVPRRAGDESHGRQGQSEARQRTAQGRAGTGMNR